MKPHRLLVILPLLLNLSFGCTKSGGGPEFIPADEEGPSASEAPSPDDALAKEAGVMRIVYHVGPVDLPAGTAAEAMRDRPLAMRFQTDKEIWATGFVPKVVDANGGELPAELLHSAVVLNLHEENPLCAGSPNPIAAATGMLTEVNLPQGHGYPILPADPIEVRAVLANPTEKSYSDVSFEITLVARAMSDFASVQDVRPILLELDPCGHAPMEVEPRAFAQRSATYQIPMKGNIVVAHGLLQDFGSAVQLTAGTEIMPFWRAEGVQDADHRVTELTGNPFEDTDGVAFKAGDSITLGVAYDNLSDDWLRSATAGAMAYLAPKD